jgi:RNA polymerase sigma-70 factor (ECF subfamily)
VTDAEVIELSLTEPDAFAALFERHFDDVHRYLRRRFPSQAEEIAADVFVAAFDGRARYRAFGDSARPWLYGIASNLLYKRRRSEARSLRAHARAGGRREVGDEPGDALVERRSAGVAAALARLSAPDRDVLLLYGLGELSYEEIAVAVDIPIGTVRSRLARARRLAAEVLDG